MKKTKRPLPVAPRKDAPQKNLPSRSVSKPQRSAEEKTYAPPELHPFNEALCRGFLPMTTDEVAALGWDRPDFVLVTGDAYVDHPSFGTAIIGRVLEQHGYRVAILAQPDWKSAADFKRFGRPRLGFLVNSGVIDSMVNHYTAARKPRSSDVYTPGGRGGCRPDRAVIVYCNRIREAYRHIPIVIGGIEASLRRFAHYDYWSNKVRRSILQDSGADLLIYGMGERPIVDIADALDAGVPVSSIDSVRGTAFLRSPTSSEPPAPWIDEERGEIPLQCIASFDEVSADKSAYGAAYMAQKQQASSVRSGRLAQQNGRDVVYVNPIALSLKRRDLDAVYDLPFQRAAHPLYKEHIPAIDEVEFSVASCRGCFGSCSFCALTYHQGRDVHSRSQDSILDEVKQMVTSPRFKGYVHDVGGPTANFRESACKKQEKGESCTHRECLHPTPCKNLRVDHSEYTDLLTRLRTIPGIKKIFVRSGLRYDYLLYDTPKRRDRFLSELVEHHISGQLKIAPEHVNGRVLDLMGKPGPELYEEFKTRYTAMNKRRGKEQYLVPYFISSHPGSDLDAAIELACYMKKAGIRPEQVQDFYPTPGTLSTAMFYTGIDPRNNRPVFVPRRPEDKQAQRALLQYFRPENADRVRAALTKAGRSDLIGFGKDALVRPASSGRTPFRTGSQERSRSKNTRHTATTRSESNIGKKARKKADSASLPAGKKKGTKQTGSRKRRG